MDSSSNEDLSDGIKRSSAPPTASHEKKRDSKSFLEEELQGGATATVGAVKEMQGVLRKSFERLLPSTNTTTTPDPRDLPPPPPQPTPPIPPLSTPEFTPLSASSEWYLLLTTAQPTVFQTHQKLPLIVSYGQKNHLRPEYWFHIVIREQVQELYQFWIQSSPETYGFEVDQQLLASRSQKLTTFSTMDLSATAQLATSTLAIDVVNKSPNKESWEMLKSPYTRLSSMISRSQTLLTSTSSSATNFGQGLLDSISDFASLDYNNEEVVSMSEELRAALYGFSNEDLLFLTPKIVGGESELLKEEDLGRLARHLTPRAEGHPLTLLFSTSRDGFSLATLFRRNAPLSEDTPILLVIQETKNSKIFGALLSTPLRTSEVFYGTGQSFLFTLEPFGVWKWSGDNMYFVKGGMDGVAIGAGDGKFGIWLDSDLNCGRTDSCSTFNNPALVEDSDFVINIIECWGFISETMTTELPPPPPPTTTAVTMTTKEEDEQITLLDEL